MIEIIEADAIEFVREFASDLGDFHAQVSDPPYSPHVHKNATSAGTNGIGTRVRDLGFDPLSGALAAAVACAAASVRGWSLIYSDFESTHLWREHCSLAGAEYIRLIPWVRWSQPQKSGDRPTTGAEAVSIFWHKPGTRKAWNGAGSLIEWADDEGPTTYTEKSLRGRDKHETEKPLDLLLSQVSGFSAPGQTVLDLVGGAGTTAQACRLLGRGCVSIELRPDWVENARARVASPLSPRDLERATRWIEATAAEAQAILDLPRAKDRTGRYCDVKTRERAERRLADVARVADALQ